MKLLKKTIMVLISFSVLALGSSFAFAENYKAEAKETGRVFHRITSESNNVYLLPETAYFGSVKDFLYYGEPEKAGFAAETLYYVTKADLVKKSKSDNKSKVDTSTKSVSKIVRSISEMKGMEYYSNTRKKWETLYLDAFRVENPEEIIPVPDNLEGNSDGKRLYAYLVEHTFGKGVYEIKYHENSKVVYMEMENATPLYYGFIKAVDPGKCKIAINVIEEEDGYFVFIGMRVDMMQLGVMEKKMNKSFQARLDAIFNWITLQF